MKTLTFVSEMLELLQYEDTNLCFRDVGALAV